jgi:hypothetical protein
MGAGDVDREILHEELGIAPSETTQQLAEAIRQGSFRPTPQPQAEPVVIVPARVPLELSVRRHNLPSQTTPFVGRQDEVADLVRLLAEPEVKLVTILAPGGMGKTRLSLAVAERQLNRFRDGVFFVPLVPLSSPADIVTTIAEQVGFSFDGSTSPNQRSIISSFSQPTMPRLESSWNAPAPAVIPTRWSAVSSCCSIMPSGCATTQTR